MFTNCHTHFSSEPDFEIFQAESNAGLRCFHSIGIHPWNADLLSVGEKMELLHSGLKENTLAIGECGLDGLKGPDFSIQIPVFEQQILLSEKVQLPLMIHCVKGWNELLQLRKKHKPVQPWIFHGFAKFGIVEQVVQSGMMISLGAAIIHHPKAIELVKNIPDKQLLLETDDKEIEIKQVYERVSELKKISLQQLNELTTTNFKNTFRKWHIG
jgi:TatD DNase family protein